jgi:translation initiation factor 5
MFPNENAEYFIGSDPTKFFGTELGAQTPIDEKNDRYIVNGAHEANRLRELLDVFIDKFVLCASCKNPETDLIIDKQENIHRDCKACGQKTDIDMRHKLTTYIIRNPPKKSKGKNNRGAHATANGTGSPDENGGTGDEDEDAFTKKIKSEAAGLPSGDQAKVDENDWSLDTSAEAVRQRAKLAAGFGALSLGDDDSEGERADSPYGQIRAWLEEKRSSASAADIYKKAQELGIEKKHKTLQILGRSLFTEDIVKQLPTNTALLKKVG